MMYDTDITHWNQTMRILTDIGDREIAALDALARKLNLSRAALIRQAIDGFLMSHHSASAGDAFGLWGDGTVDGLAYQEALRREW